MSRLLLSLVLVPLAAPGLDLTPTRGLRDLEGFSIPIVHFSDGAQRVSFQPPRGWNLTGSGAILNLYPSDRPDVSMQLRVHAKAPGAITPEELQAWGQQFLPKDATKMVFEGETISPFTLRALPSREMTFSYTAQGRRFFTSVAAVDLSAQERFAVVITARSPDFKEAREEAIRSLFTMNWSE